MLRILKFFTLFSFLSIQSSFAQTCNDATYMKEGAVWEMGSFDKKGNLEATTKSFVKKSTKLSNGVSWLVNALVTDKKGKKVSDSDIEVRCEGNNFFINPKHLLDPRQMQSMKDMEISIETVDLEYPIIMNKGNTLKNGSINVKASTSGIQVMNMMIEVLDRKVEEFEEITVKAGNFKAYRISQTTKVTNNIVKIETNSVDYYVPGFGVIKSISYNKKGEQDGYSELMSYTKP
ncbi:MAG: hypothetical protein SNJ77_09945 [Cytophagales bacterium]